MGFRNGAYAMVWKVEYRNNMIVVNLSTSRKKRGVEPPEYETDFSGFASFYGEAAKKGSETIGLQPKTKSRILECEVTTRYDANRDERYTNFNVYDWEPASEPDGNPAPATPPQPVAETKKKGNEGSEDEDDLPF